MADDGVSRQAQVQAEEGWGGGIVTMAAIYSASEAVVNRDGWDWRCSLEFELELDLAKSKEEGDDRRGSMGPRVSDDERGSGAGERARAQALVGPLGLLGRVGAGEAGGASWACVAGPAAAAGLVSSSHFLPISPPILFLFFIFQTLVPYECIHVLHTCTQP